jgi:hypothetical protein
LFNHSRKIDLIKNLLETPFLDDTPKKHFHKAAIVDH